jgi:hypothetical protein
MRQSDIVKTRAKMVWEPAAGVLLVELNKHNKLEMVNSCGCGCCAGHGCRSYNGHY